MINQISVFLENRAGQLAETTRLLADKGINLRAISIAETSDYGVLRILVDDADRAAEILLSNGNIISKTPVSVVAVPDRPAGLSDVLNVLEDGNIDIEYMYSLFNDGKDNAYMVFRVTDATKLRETLENGGIKLLSSEELGLK